MTKIDIFSGFLGAGKTTLIKKLIGEAYQGEKLVLIENEFGEIGIDGGFLQDAGIEITEMNSGCICCSLVGDFAAALQKVLAQYHPDRILIEPSGVGKLSDVIRAVQGIGAADIALNSFTTVVDANKCKMYMQNFGEFFDDQIERAGCIVLSRTANLKDARVQAAVDLLRAHNAGAPIVTTPWDALTGSQILEAMERRGTLDAALEQLAGEQAHHEHHLEHGEVCGCGHEHGHEHEHGHGEACGCGHEHGRSHAEEVFDTWGIETLRHFDREGLQALLDELDEGRYGQVLRAKGIVASEGETWFHFDYVPGDAQVRDGSAGVTGRLCVIGAGLDKPALAGLFGV